LLFTEACRLFGRGEYRERFSETWCSWTTFARLQSDAGYWTSGLPNAPEVLDTYIRDGGTWGQPFLYAHIAHLIIPRQFFWDHAEPGHYESGYKYQDVEALAASLSGSGIPFRISPYAFEVKLY
jgi:hypothetical protein